VSIRTILLFCIFAVMALFVAASSWLGMRGMARLQENALQTFHAELLNEGTAGLETAVQQLCTIYENLPPDLKTGDPAKALAPFLTAGGADNYLILDGKGTALPTLPVAPALQPLLDAGALPAFFEEARQGGPKDIVIDNYTEYLDGNADAPVMVKIHAFPEQNLMLGLGRVQETTGIRLESFSEASANAYEALTRGSLGLHLCLIIVAMTLVWVALQQFFFRPLSRIMGAMSGNPDDEAPEHLTWKRFKEYAARVQTIAEEKNILRGKLEREIEVRFQAEEERDALNSTMERSLRATRQEMQLQAEKGLQELQAAIMRREARVIHHQLVPGLETALRELPEVEDNRAARTTLSQCLLTTRALGDRDLKPLLNLRDIALAPWLKGLVEDFERTRSLSVVSNFCGDIQAKIDPDALRHAVEYVMENAADASPRDRNIRVDLAREGDSAEIRVIDSGQGIADDARPHIFVPFYSIDAQSDGLGLAVTRSVVEQHGGSIQLHTESEKGTAVIIRIPAS
jgi:signal transduction histidine kinase